MFSSEPLRRLSSRARAKNSAEFYCVVSPRIFLWSVCLLTLYLHLSYNITMETIQTFLQTIWASILVLGWVKIIIAVVAISILSKYQYILGLVAALLLIAYLGHWINF